jgi:minimal PKS acyl carrier protein
MEEFTVEDLKRYLRECAGEDEQEGLTADRLDLPFEDLGYDSLAVMETTSRIERELHVVLPEAEIAFVSTPRDYLSFVNGRLAGGPGTPGAAGIPAEQ